MATLSTSSFASAQKQPCALRYSGQVPGCSTKVPCAGRENTAGFNSVLQSARTMSGAHSLMNCSAAGEFGLDVCSTAVSPGKGG